MQLDFNQIKNKQRIFIGGNSGTDEIIKIVSHVLHYLKKPFDLFQNGEGQLTDAPMIIFNGMNELNPETGKAYFHEMKPHIGLFHKITEPVPTSYPSFEDFINQYELLADSLPKAGTLLYYQSDNVSLMIGKKERDDIKNIEYKKLKSQRAGDKITLEFKSGGEVSFELERSGLPGEMAAALNIANRFSIKEKKFIKAIQNYQPGV
ncbi:MAG: hypothetical protein ACFHWX_07540 [Bacteroidota bacterium]